MRFIKGPIPKNESFQPRRDGWTPLQEFGPQWIPYLAALFGSPVAAWLYLMSGLSLSRISLLELDIILLCLLLLVPLHELLHALFMPRSRGWNAVVIGFWYRRGIFFAHYEGEMKKARFMTALIAPLIIISVLPGTIMAFAGVHDPLVTAVPVLHAFLCGGDLYGIAGVALRIPNGATVRNNGWRTYWKMKRDMR